MIDVFKIFNDAWVEHEIEGSMDLRITMSKKGIKVNLGIGSDSNKPNSFDLVQAMLDSCNIALKDIEKSIILYTEEDKKNWVWYYVKRKAFIYKVIEKLS